MIMVLHVRRTAAATLILVLATVAPRQHVTAFVFPISSTAPTNRRRETPRTQFRNSNINSARNSKSSRRIGRRRSANNRVRPALWSPSSALRTCTDTRRNTRWVNTTSVFTPPISVHVHFFFLQQYSYRLAALNRYSCDISNNHRHRQTTFTFVTLDISRPLLVQGTAQSTAASPLSRALMDYALGGCLALSLSCQIPEECTAERRV